MDGPPPKKASVRSRATLCVNVCDVRTMAQSLACTSRALVRVDVSLPLCVDLYQ